MKKLFSLFTSFLLNKYDYRVLSALDKKNNTSFYMQRRLIGRHNWSTITNKSKIIVFQSLVDTKQYIKNKNVFNGEKYSFTKLNSFFRPVIFSNL